MKRCVNCPSVVSMFASAASPSLPPAPRSRFRFTRPCLLLRILKPDLNRWFPERESKHKDGLKVLEGQEHETNSQTSCHAQLKTCAG